jgi:hypothetical protein
MYNYALLHTTHYALLPNTRHPALALNEFSIRPLRLTCTDDQLIIIPYQPTRTGNDAIVHRSLLSDAYVLPCKWTSGVEVLDSYGIAQQHSFAFSF